MRVKIVFEECVEPNQDALKNAFTRALSGIARDGLDFDLEPPSNLTGQMDPKGQMIYCLNKAKELHAPPYDVTVFFIVVVLEVVDVQTGAELLLPLALIAACDKVMRSYVVAQVLSATTPRDIMAEIIQLQTQVFEEYGITKQEIGPGDSIQMDALLLGTAGVVRSQIQNLLPSYKIVTPTKH